MRHRKWKGPVDVRRDLFDLATPFEALVGFDESLVFLPSYGLHEHRRTMLQSVVCELLCSLSSSVSLSPGFLSALIFLRLLATASISSRNEGCTAKIGSKSALFRLYMSQIDTAVTRARRSASSDSNAISPKKVPRPSTASNPPSGLRTCTCPSPMMYLRTARSSVADGSSSLNYNRGEHGRFYMLLQGPKCASSIVTMSGAMCDVRK